MTIRPIRRAGGPLARQQGISSAELLTVVVIAGMLAVLAAPEIRRSFARARVQAAVDEMATKVRQARMLAVKSKTAHRVRVVEGAEHLSLETEREVSGGFVTVDGGSTPLDATVTLLGSSTLDQVDVTARGVCDAGRIQFTESTTDTQKSIEIERSCSISRY